MQRMLRWLTACENALAALGPGILVFITLAVCAEVLLRYGFHTPISSGGEISEYALLWMTFLGSSWVLRNGGHVRVDILLQFLPHSPLRFCGLLSSASGVLTSLVLILFGTNVTWTAIARGSFRPTRIDPPPRIRVVSIPVRGPV